MFETCKGKKILTTCIQHNLYVYLIFLYYPLTPPPPPPKKQQQQRQSANATKRPSPDQIIFSNTLAKISLPP